MLSAEVRILNEKISGGSSHQIWLGGGGGTAFVNIEILKKIFNGWSPRGLFPLHPTNLLSEWG